MRDVVTVPEISQCQSGKITFFLPDRLQVGKRLARVGVVGKRVDHGHRSRRGQPFQPLLRERPYDDHIDVPAEDGGRVLDGLAPAKLGGRRVHHHRVPAELGHGDVEGQPGPGGGLLEQQHHRTAGKRPGLAGTRAAGRLQPVRRVQDGGLFLRRQVGVEEEVSGHETASKANRASNKASIVGSAGERGAQRRALSGCTVMRRP